MTIYARFGFIFFVVLASFAAGIYVGYRVGGAQLFAEEAVLMGRYAVMLELARIEGTDSAYENALNDYLVFLESRQGDWTPMFSEQVHAMESALTYARLSMLAEKRGEPIEVSKLRKLAESHCPETGVRDCSAERISTLAQRLDQNELLTGAD